MQIADYQSGDELEVCAWLGGRTIAEASAVERLTPDIWRWRYTAHPLQPAPRAVIARRDGQLLGYAAAVPATVLAGGTAHRAVQIHFDAATAEAARPLHDALFERLAGQNVALAFALVGSEHDDLYASMQFTQLFELHARNLYLGLSGVSQRLDKSALMKPFRRFAQGMVSLRPKLVEVPFDEGSIGHLERLFAANRDRDLPEISIERSAPWLAWRYQNRPGKQFRMLQVRRKAGAGIDAIAIVRLFEYEPGRVFIQLMDHTTREGGRRATAWLVGEVAMWGLAERADVLQAYAATGSELDQALLGSGCIRKKRIRNFFARWFGDAASSPLAAPFPTKHVDLCAGVVEL